MDHRLDRIGNALNSLASFLDSVACGCFFEYGIIIKRENEERHEKLQKVKNAVANGAVEQNLYDQLDKANANAIKESDEQFGANVVEAVGSIASMVAEICHEQVEDGDPVFMIPMLMANSNDCWTGWTALALSKSQSSKIGLFCNR